MNMTTLLMKGIAMTRMKTDIKVYVLNMSALEKQNTKYLKLKYKQVGYIAEDLKLKVCGTWGYIKTNYGLFLLNRTGNGLVNPVGENPVPGELTLNLCQVSDGIIQPLTLVACDVNLNLLKICTIEEEMALEDFILRVSPQTEKCFEEWYKMIAKLNSIPPKNVPYEDEEEYIPVEDEVEEVEEYFEPEEVKQTGDATLDTKIMLAKNICKKEDVAKYGRFLMGSKCECVTPEVLCNVKENICSCGNSSSHSHCSKCGKVV